MSAVSQIINFLPTLVHAVGWALTLALICIGLTLVFDVLGFFNMTHGIFYMFTAMFLGTGFLSNFLFNSFFLMAVTSIVMLTVLGILLERYVFRPVEGDVDISVVLTIGLLFFFEQLALWGFGGQRVSIPSPIGGSITAFGLNFAVYDFFMIFAAGFTLIAFRYFLRNTSQGRNIKAIANNRSMAAAHGINVDIYVTFFFGITILLTCIGSVLAAPVLGGFYTADIPILILACVVIIVGGVGSIQGTIMAAFIIVLSEYIILSFTPISPTFSRAISLSVMVVVLLLRPEGISPGEI